MDEMIKMVGEKNLCVLSKFLLGFDSVFLLDKYSGYF